MTVGSWALQLIFSRGGAKKYTLPSQNLTDLNSYAFSFRVVLFRSRKTTELHANHFGSSGISHWRQTVSCGSLIFSLCYKHASLLKPPSSSLLTADESNNGTQTTMKVHYPDQAVPLQYSFPIKLSTDTVENIIFLADIATRRTTFSKIGNFKMESVDLQSAENS